MLGARSNPFRHLGAQHSPWMDGQPGTSGVPVNIVRVNFAGTGGAMASPYTAKPGDFVMVDASGGAIVVNLPTLTKGGLSVDVEQDSSTAFSNTITVNGPAAVSIDQPVPLDGTYVSAFVFGPGQTVGAALGQHYSWFNGGNAGGYSLT